MTISIKDSIEVAANQQRCSTTPLPGASPHQSPQLLLCLASCRTEYLLLCVASIIHYPFHLHLDFKLRYRANVNNNKCAALQQRVTQARCLLLRYVTKFSACALSPSAVRLLQLPPPRLWTCSYSMLPQAYCCANHAATLFRLLRYMHKWSQP
jgi:hypothetical protein